MESNKPNIVVICLDSVRQDFFEKYAPRTKQLADTVFTQCRAASSWSTPSHASMFTGVLPYKHGIHTYQRDFSAISRSETFLANLEQYRIHGASANTLVSSAYGFDELFDKYDEINPQCRYPQGLDPRRFYDESDTTGIQLYINFLRSALHHDNTIDSLRNAIVAQVYETTKTSRLPKLVDDGATAVLRQSRKAISNFDRPVFSFLNIMDAHIPLRATLFYDKSMYSVSNSWSSHEYNTWELINSDDSYDDYWQKRRELYRATIDYLDRRIERFAKRVQELSERETTIIVTSDHGDNLGSEADNYLANHRSSLTEGLLHVPLYIINPPRGYAEKEQKYFSHTEMGELINGISENSASDVFSDQIASELVGLSAGESPPDDRDFWNRMIRCIYQGNHKWVWDSLGNTQTYELDPNQPNWQSEVSNYTGSSPDYKSIFDIDIKEYKQRVNNESAGSEVDPVTKDRLKELGYL